MWCLITTLLVLQGFVYITGSKFEVDILEVNWNISTPELIDINVKLVQPTRGVFGVSGYFDLKQDIDTDHTLAEVKFYYSTNGISYLLSAFHIPKQSFTKCLNGPYKEYLMEGMAKSCENAPQHDTFVSPLTERLIKCENFLFPSDNFSPTLRLGYYRVVVIMTAGLGVNFSMLVKVDLA